MPAGIHPTAPTGHQSHHGFRVDREPLSVESFAGYAQRHAEKPYAVVSWGAAGIKLVSRVASEAAAQRLLEKSSVGRSLSHTIERLVPDAERLHALTTGLPPTDPLIGATLLEAWGCLEAAGKTLLTPLQWIVTTYARLYSGGVEFAFANTLDVSVHEHLQPNKCPPYTTEIGARVYINAWEWVLPMATPRDTLHQLPRRAGKDATRSDAPPPAIDRAALPFGAMRRAVPRHPPRTAVMFRGVSEDTSITLDERTAVPRATPPAPAEAEPLLRVASGGRRR